MDLGPGGYMKRWTLLKGASADNAVGARAAAGHGMARRDMAILHAMARCSILQCAVDITLCTREGVRTQHPEKEVQM